MNISPNSAFDNQSKCILLKLLTVLKDDRITVQEISWFEICKNVLLTSQNKKVV